MKCRNCKSIIKADHAYRPYSDKYIWWMFYPCFKCKKYSLSKDIKNGKIINEEFKSDSMHIHAIYDYYKLIIYSKTNENTKEILLDNNMLSILNSKNELNFIMNKIESYINFQ